MTYSETVGLKTRLDFVIGGMGAIITLFFVSLRY
jgi:hypothetical protein